jgi:hypothetical protein
MRNFENWETQDLEITFGLNRQWESDKLANISQIVAILRKVKDFIHDN